MNKHKRIRRRIDLLCLSLLFPLVFCFSASARGSQPCAPDLPSCPARGCAKQGSPDALTNEMKRHQPNGNKPMAFTFDDFESLQEQADKLVGQKVALNVASRKKLSNLKTSGGKVAEGDLVAVTGYLVGSPHPNTSGESVNCGLKGNGNNDFHIPMARNPEDTEFEGIVVEMIPQNRPQEWTIAKLRAVQRQGKQVRVLGQLFYDNKHLVNSNPDDAMGGQPKRFSLWEIHPVTEFLVCKKHSCGDKPADWQKLENYR